MNTQPIDGLNGSALYEHGHDRGHTQSSSWIGGVILIGTGILLLLQHLHITGYHWCALFMLIPTVSAFSKAWAAYQAADRRLTAPVRSALIGGTFLYLIAAIFLFG